MMIFTIVKELKNKVDYWQYLKGIVSMIFVHSRKGIGLANRN